MCTLYRGLILGYTLGGAWLKAHGLGKRITESIITQIAPARITVRTECLQGNALSICVCVLWSALSTAVDPLSAGVGQYRNPSVGPASHGARVGRAPNISATQIVVW